MKISNCEIGGCPERSTITCPTCKHWIPCKKHKYYNCSRFLASRIQCNLPKSHCKTCPHYIVPKVGRPEASEETKVDQKKKRKAYIKEYMKDYRKKKKAAIDPEHQKFIEKQLANLPKVEDKTIPLTINGKPM